MPISYYPLVLAIEINISNKEMKIEFLQLIEKIVFASGLSRSAAIARLDPIMLAIHIYRDQKPLPEILDYMKGIFDEISKSTEIEEALASVGSYFNGFFRWHFVRYFLYEYDLSLKESGFTSRRKIQWEIYSDAKEDHHTIEHIYPQNARQRYWVDRFPNLSAAQRDKLRNSLGNLLPLSRPKNSSLSNKPFPEKVDDGSGSAIGYRYGSYAENEVAAAPEWTPEQILSRGVRMLTFMEKRWGINLGSDQKKRAILGLEFVKFPDSSKEIIKKEKASRRRK